MVNIAVNGSEVRATCGTHRKKRVKIQKISINEFEPKVNYASVAHKIILFKETKPKNMSCTQKHNSINIYDKSIRLMLMHFGNHSKNARVHFGKAHGNKICSFFLFLCVPTSKRIACKEGCDKLYEYLESFLSKKKVSYDLATPKR